MKENKCDSCGKIGVYLDICESCCTHEFDPDEGYHCLACGKDGAEEVMSAAYDRYKDFKKYGE